tara:strand:- start:499 stop:2097 length:1599 start_codon:yes stop_codon:yes gene_type:complete
MIVDSMINKLSRSPQQIAEQAVSSVSPMAMSPQPQVPQAQSVIPEGLVDMSEEDKNLLDILAQRGQIKSEAPLGSLGQELAMAGQGEDTELAHLRAGEIVLPPEMLEDEEVESLLETKFRELGINPEEAIVGAGVASLNPMTGLEEFGFFKKLKKVFGKVGKVIRKVAPIAAFVPGVGTALGGVLGGLGGLATKIPVIGGALQGVGQFLSPAISGLAGLGIPGISPIAGGIAGGAGSIKAGLSNLFAGGPFGGAGTTFAGGPAAGTGLTGALGLGAPTATGGTSGLLGALTGGGGSGGGGGGVGNLLGLAGAGALAAKLGELAFDEAKRAQGVPLTPLTTMDASGRYNIEAEIARRMGQPAPNPVEFGLLPQGTIPELSGGQPRMASLGGAIENIEKNMAYGGGVYGNGLEDLTGGLARGMQAGGPVMQYAQGGAVQGFREGGEIEPQDFPRRDGPINGAGTETSDDIPAMLSDGEYVMTGRAVRGAGSFELQNQGGILSLVPSFEEDRERGMANMYKIMDAFEASAQPSSE